MTTIRASSMPLAFLCSASLFEPGYNSTNPAAQLGTNIHAWCKAMVEGKDPSIPDDDDMRILAFQARKIWEEERQWFPNPRRTEVELTHKLTNSVRLTGHADVLSVKREGSTVLIGDWKSGWRTDADYRDQLMAYAYLASRRWRKANVFHCRTFWLRTAEVDGIVADRADIFNWEDRLLRSIGGGRDYTTGAHCRFCKAAPTCPANRARMTAFVDAPPTITAESAGDVYDNLLILESLCKGVREALTAYAEQDGPGPLRIVQKFRRDIIPTMETWEHLTQHTSLESLLSATRIMSTGLDRLIADGTPAGGKKAAIDQMHKVLDEQGAIRTTSYGILERRKEV